MYIFICMYVRMYILVHRTLDVNRYLFVVEQEKRRVKSNKFPTSFLFFIFPHRERPFQERREEKKEKRAGL